nr:PAS domain-containing protein [uncultured Capnocytophaga sp.]
MSDQVMNKPTPINEEVAWDKTKTIISTTDKFGTITDVNQTFIDVCGYSASELLGKPHNIIRHPDMPKIVFKVTWDNILAGRNFHAIIKNLAKSGKYYWVITDFEVGRNIMGEVVTIMARRRAVPQQVITDHIEPLYQTLLKLEKIGGMELSNRYFKSFLEKQGKSYIDYIMDILDDKKRAPQEIHFDPISNAHNDTDIGDYEISDDIFSEEHPEEESMVQRKSFFAKLFSTN